MDELAEALLAGAPPERLAALPVPTEYSAVHLRAEDVDMFGGAADKDVRKSLRVGLVPMPALAPDECLIAVMASSINYNTVWSAMFEPIPTFRFLRQYGAQGRWESRHDRSFHVVGSDAAGVIVRVGEAVRRWHIGDHVVVSPMHVDDQEPETHADAMLGAEVRAWGFETNFGGLAHYAVVRATQLVRKPPHLTWEEAACNPLCAGTAYRMLVGAHGAQMKQGDVVLIWGATGGLGVYAVQLVRNGGGVAVGVVSSEYKAEQLRRLGCDVVINRSEIGGLDVSDNPAGVAEAGRQLGAAIRREVGEDPHIVFDHVGRATFGLSVFVARRGGVVVTCGSSTGYHHHFDNRYLWMRLKRIVGSHAANLQEQSELHRLVAMGRIRPMLSMAYGMDDTAEAARLVQRNRHVGKVGVLCLAPSRGLGVTDPERRSHFGGDSIAPLLDEVDTDGSDV